MYILGIACRKHLRKLTLLWPLLCLACTSSQDKKVSTIFHADEKKTQAAQYDLEDLQQNGELIAITLSGPETYFEFRGQGFGLQYELIADFAQKQGLRMRMEIAHDTLEMIEKLDKGEVDVIALPMPIIGDHIQSAIQDTLNNKTIGWLTRQQSEELANALNNWYSPALVKQIKDKYTAMASRQKLPARHNPRPKMRDLAHGVISEYDELFKRNASVCGWDWRLLAAQCFQESSFDPQAVSYAGAQGLMQLMPSTASRLNVQSNVFDPSTNVNAAARLIKELDGKLNDISNSDERINFILASYNGGIGHIRDAMALTKKYGGNSQKWDEVEAYILKLSSPEFYRDPVVKYGYLRGTETAGYVRSIRSHWQYYRTATNQ